MDAILAEINALGGRTVARDSKRKRKLSKVVASKSSFEVDGGALSKKYSFATDYNDHFETPHIAYVDIYNILCEFAKTINKPIQDLVIYDPYFCDGTMKEYLTSMGTVCDFSIYISFIVVTVHCADSIGFVNIVNNNRDFYSDIKHGCVPGILNIV